MEWQGEATVLARRKHGETAVILTVFAADAGVLTGVVPGGVSPRRAAMLQPGNRLRLVRRARTEEQIGTFTPEPAVSRAALMGDPLSLAGLNAVTALLVWALPERDPHPRLHAATEALLDRMAAPGWGRDYLGWELGLLDALGFGLALEACAVSGAREGLAFVSPRTGHAVTAAAAGDWADRLLRLPACLGGPADAASDAASDAATDPAGDLAGDLSAGLTLTGWFLDHRLGQEMLGRPVPPARARLVARLAAA